MARIASNAAISCIYLNFWHEVSRLVAKHVDAGEVDVASRVVAAFENGCKKFRNVTEVNIAHMVIVKLEPTARTWEGIQREVELTNSKVHTLIQRLTKKLP